MITESIVGENLPKHEFQNRIFSTLKQFGYRYDVNSATENKLQLLVYGGINSTNVLLERNPHKPSIVQLSVDSLNMLSMRRYNKHIAKLGKKKNNNTGFYRYYFYLIIISSVASLFTFFLSKLFNSTQQIIVFLLVIVVLIIGYFTFRPNIQNLRKKTLQEFDQSIFNIVASSIRPTEMKMEKCWNCFSNKLITDKFCDSCGK